MFQRERVIAALEARANRLNLRRWLQFAASD